jgi:hypothetical protein
LNQEFPDWKEFVLPKEITKPIDIYKYLYKLKKGKDMLKVGGSLLDYSKRLLIVRIGKSIKEIPETLPPNLQKLHLPNNLISEIPETLPQNLQMLNLFNNKIKEIPDTLPQNLKYLHLRDNPSTKKVVIPGVRVQQ